MQPDWSLGKSLTTAAKAERTITTAVVSSGGETIVTDQFSVSSGPVGSATVLFGSLPDSLDQRSITVYPPVGTNTKWSRYIERMTDTQDWLQALHGQPFQVSTKTASYAGTLEQHSKKTVTLRQNNRLIQLQRKIIEAMELIPPPGADLTQRAAADQLLVLLDQPLAFAQPVSCALNYACLGSKSFAYGALYTLTLNADHSMANFKCAVTVTNNTNVDFPRTEVKLLERKQDVGRQSYLLPDQSSDEGNAGDYDDDDTNSQTTERAMPRQAARYAAAPRSAMSVRDGGGSAALQTGSRIIELGELCLPRRSAVTAPLNELSDIAVDYRFISRNEQPYKDVPLSECVRLLTWLRADQEQLAARAGTLLPSGLAVLMHQPQGGDQPAQPLLDSITERVAFGTWSEASRVKLVLGSGNEVRVKRTVIRSEPMVELRRLRIVVRVDIINRANFVCNVRLEESMPSLVMVADNLTLEGIYYSIAGASNAVQDYCNTRVTDAKFFAEPKRQGEVPGVHVPLDTYDEYVSDALRVVAVTVPKASGAVPSVTAVVYSAVISMGDGQAARYNNNKAGF
jgi:hypothetical protein